MVFLQASPNEASIMSSLVTHRVKYSTQHKSHWDHYLLLSLGEYISFQPSNWSTNRKQAWMIHRVRVQIDNFSQFILEWNNRIFLEWLQPIKSQTLHIKIPLSVCWWCEINNWSKIIWLLLMKYVDFVKWLPRMNSN